METLIKKFKKMSTSQLIVKSEKATGMDLEAINAVLTQRGEIVPAAPIVEPEVIDAPEVVKEHAAPETVSPVYEAVPETDLTPEEEKLVAEATEKLDAETVTEPVKTTLLEKVAIHVATFKKGSNGFNKIKMIIRDRKLSKLSDPELKIILSIPAEKPSVDAPKVDKLKVDKPKTDKPKADKVEGEKKESTRKAKVLASVLRPEIFAGVKVSFVLNSRRGGLEATGVVSSIHVKGDKEFVLIKTDADGIIVSKVPKNLTIITPAATEPEVK